MVVANTYTARAQYFSKEYVDDLIVFHQRERDSFNAKIATLETEVGRQREEIGRLNDDLARQSDKARYQQEYAERING